MFYLCLIHLLAFLVLPERRWGPRGSAGLRTKSGHRVVRLVLALGLNSYPLQSIFNITQCVQRPTFTHQCFTGKNKTMSYQAGIAFPSGKGILCLLDVLSAIHLSVPHCHITMSDFPYQNVLMSNMFESCRLHPVFKICARC